MTRLVLFLVAAVAVAMGLSWLSDHDRPASLVINWMGYEIETTVFRAVVLLAFLVGLSIFAWSIIRQIWTSPAVGRPVLQPPPPGARPRCAFERHDRHRRRRSRAGDALCGAGAEGAAERAADASAAGAGGATFGRPGDLAADLRGDARLARYRATRLARTLSRGRTRGRARGRPPVRGAGAGLNPKLAWPVDALFDLQCKAADWAGALETLARRREARPCREADSGPPPRRAADRPGPGRSRRRTATRRWNSRSRRTAWRPIWCRPQPSRRVSWRRVAIRRRPPRSSRGRGSSSPHPDLAVGLCVRAARRQSARPARPHQAAGAIDAAFERRSDRGGDRGPRSAQLGARRARRWSRCSKAGRRSACAR